jgi:CRP/FNR family cyclic AMP-dependent transcriptional regulator
VIEVTAAALAAHPFLHGMSRGQLSVLATTASEDTFEARHRIFADGGNATRFWLIQSGRVSLDLDIPGEGPVVIGTVGLGELLGWSWLIPPFTWAFGAIAATPVRAFEFDAPAVRECCAADPGLGYDLTKRMTLVLAKRLQTTRIRLLTRFQPPGLPITQFDMLGDFCG